MWAKSRVERFKKDEEDTREYNPRQITGGKGLGAVSLAFKSKRDVLEQLEKEARTLDTNKSGSRSSMSRASNSRTTQGVIRKALKELADMEKQLHAGELQRKALADEIQALRNDQSSSAEKTIEKEATLRELSERKEGLEKAIDEMSSARELQSVELEGIASDLLHSEVTIRELVQHENKLQSQLIQAERESSHHIRECEDHIRECEELLMDYERKNQVSRQCMEQLQAEIEWAAADSALQQSEMESIRQHQQWLDAADAKATATALDEAAWKCEQMALRVDLTEAEVEEVKEANAKANDELCMCLAELAVSEEMRESSRLHHAKEAEQLGKANAQLQELVQLLEQQCAHAKAMLEAEVQARAESERASHEVLTLQCSRVEELETEMAAEVKARKELEVRQSVEAETQSSKVTELESLLSAEMERREVKERSVVAEQLKVEQLESMLSAEMERREVEERSVVAEQLKVQQLEEELAGEKGRGEEGAKKMALLQNTIEELKTLQVKEEAGRAELEEELEIERTRKAQAVARVTELEVNASSMRDTLADLREQRVVQQSKMEEMEGELQAEKMKGVEAERATAELCEVITGLKEVARADQAKAAGGIEQLRRQLAEAEVEKHEQQIELQQQAVKWQSEAARLAEQHMKNRSKWDAELARINELAAVQSAEAEEMRQQAHEAASRAVALEQQLHHEAKQREGQVAQQEVQLREILAHQQKIAELVTEREQAEASRLDAVQAAEKRGAEAAIAQAKLKSALTSEQLAFVRASASEEVVSKLTDENARLAGHQNPKQRIRHLQQLKSENVRLAQELSQAQAIMRKAGLTLKAPLQKKASNRAIGSAAAQH
ncbi:unnamed protein product [Chrysoparadoxa australica]